jgi:hypothetical protein
MRKLKLQVDSLEVQSFHTSHGVPRPGTVRAHATYGESCEGTCNTDCWGACGGTAGTCPGTQQPTCYGTACDTWCCTPNTACLAITGCGDDTCQQGCTAPTNVPGCVE